METSTNNQNEDLYKTNERLVTRSDTLKERITWAINKPQNIEKKSGITIKQQIEKEQLKEKNWGNLMIGNTNNKQWSTKLGEELVFDVLELRGENPRKITKKNGFQPDWETDNYIYEVKNSSWMTSGTAGEKVFGTWIKYQDIPELYGKPLRIVCVANQEYEFEYGKIKYFGKDISQKTQQVLDLARSWNIEYIRFSDLASTIIDQL